MRFFPTLCLFFLLAGNLFSQSGAYRQRRIDSLTFKLKKDSAYTFRFKKLRPYANIDNRNSFITKRPTNISGFQLGAIVNEYHTFGVGLYRLNSASHRDAPIRDNYRIDYLQYFTSFYEYVLVNHRFIEIDLPFEFGIGKYKAQHIDTVEPNVHDPVSYGFIPLGAAGKVILKPVRWIGLSVMGGYRYVLENKLALLNLDGSYYSFGVWIDLRQIYRDVKYYGFQKRKYKREISSIEEEKKLM